MIFYTLADYEDIVMFAIDDSDSPFPFDEIFFLLP